MRRGLPAAAACYALGGFLFSGDTLFPAGPGRTDGPERFAEIMGTLDRLFADRPNDPEVIARNELRASVLDAVLANPGSMNPRRADVTLLFARAMTADGTSMAKRVSEVPQTTTK